jgi:hypothetical protein
MAGTLLVYDDAFPRARVAAGPIRNTPEAAELRDNNYPLPCRLLAIPEAAAPANYIRSITSAARAMRPLDCLIIFGHGRVVSAATARGATPVTTGIIIGAADITSHNASSLSALRGLFSRSGRAELWVCEAAAAGSAGGQSGIVMCQSIADALGVPVLAAPIEQQYDTRDQREIDGGGWQSTARFLPWEGTPQRFAPRRGR